MLVRALPPHAELWAALRREAEAETKADRIRERAQEIRERAQRG